MNILGIHDGQDPSVALVRDGRLAGFEREASYHQSAEANGFPHRALRRLMLRHGLAPDGVDSIAFAGHAVKVPRTRRELLKQFSDESAFSEVAKTALSYVIPGAFRTEMRKKDRLAELSRYGLESGRASFVDAHLASAMTAYASTTMDRRCLVLVAGSGSDRMAATVHVAQAGRLERIATIHEEDALGALCEHVTYLLGMSPMRDEGLLMDLGANSRGPLASSAAKRFQILFEFDELLPLNWQRAANMPETSRAHEFLRTHFRRRRFDHIAGGWYQFLCNFMAEWVGRCAHKTEIRDVLLAGDLFELGAVVTACGRRREVVSVAPSPLPGSAGNSIGAAMLVHTERSESHDASDGVREHRRLLPGVYGFDSRDPKLIERIVTSYGERASVREHVSIERPDDLPARCADLLAAGALLARFDGPLDLRLRGLGNRCLLARADHPPARERLRDVLYPDSFWATQAYLWKAENLRANFTDADTLPEAPCGEFYLTPRNPSPWFGLNARQRVPVHAIAKSANPGCWELLHAFQQSLPSTPLVTGTWRSQSGMPVRSVMDALSMWREQELDGLILHDWLLLRGDW